MENQQLLRDREVLEARLRGKTMRSPSLDGLTQQEHIKRGRPQVGDYTTSSGPSPQPDCMGPGQNGDVGQQQHHRGLYMGYENIGQQQHDQYHSTHHQHSNPQDLSQYRNPHHGGGNHHHQAPSGHYHHMMQPNNIFTDDQQIQMRASNLHCM
mmetsp:Transcript_3390/g.3804  ORF Transcript_3390/g.3804 Transcript_3390/m.3804 type:complete len:153 (+) Transcript_3390:2-460(+)